MAKWCFFLMIVCVVDNAHQYPSNDKEILRDSCSEEIYDGSAFQVCQNMLNQMTEKLRHEGDIYKLLQDRGTPAAYWMFEEGIGKYWCMSEKSPVIQFSWNPGKHVCVNLRIFDGTMNFTEFICDVSTGQRVLDVSSFDTETMKEQNAKTKRSLNKKIIHSFINLAKEIEITECSTPILNVYLNQQLVFSNASGVVGNDEPMDTLQVHINVDTTRFTNLLPFKSGKTFFISTYKKSYFDAKQDCHNRSMRLLTIKSQEETDEVVAAMYNNKQTRFWTSGKESPDQSTWYWSEGDEIIYRNWVYDEPNDSVDTESCMSVLQDGEWIDVYCSADYYFICESIQHQTPPTVKIYSGDNLTFQSLPEQGYNQDRSNVFELKIGSNDASINHSAKFQLLKKNSPQETPFEQRVVIPENFEEEEFYGIDIRIEIIRKRNLNCHKDKIFHVHTEIKMNYVNAQEFCKNLSSQLASIQNKQQQSDIDKLVSKSNIDHYYWTSGHLAENGGTWLWNGNEAITYSNWATWEPNNAGGNEKCIEVFMPYWKTKWNDQECQDKNNIICESFSEPYWYPQPV